MTGWLLSIGKLPLVGLYLLAAALVVYISIKLGDYLDVIDKKSNISGAFLGGILLAAVTSLPELFSSLTATLFIKDNSIVAGNVLGSNLFNMFVFAIIIFFFYKKMVEANTPKSFLITMGFLAALYFLTCIAGFVFEPLKWIFGYFNPISILIFVVYGLSVWKTPTFSEESEEEETEIKTSLKTAVILFIVCSVVLVGASICLAYLTDAISETFSLGSSFGGALFLGVATSLPELTSTITLCRKKNFVASYGNLIGSCVFNFLIMFISDALSFGCGEHRVYTFDQSSFLMIVLGAVEMIVIVIMLIIMIRKIDPNKLSNRFLFYGFALIIAACYILFIILSNVDLGLSFAPYVIAG